MSEYRNNNSSSNGKYGKKKSVTTSQNLNKTTLETESQSALDNSRLIAAHEEGRNMVLLNKSNAQSM